MSHRSWRGVALLVAFGIASACGRAQAPTETRAATDAGGVTVDSAAVDAAAAAVEAGPAFDRRPFTMGPEVHFTVLRGQAKITPLPVKSSSGATFSPDGSTFVVDVIEPRRTGALLVSATNPAGVFFATPEVHDVRFSPSGREVLVLDDETRTATVLSVPDGRELGHAHPAWLARFESDDAVPFWDGCRVVVLDPKAGTQRVVGGSTDTCGGADATADGRSFVVGVPSRTGVLLERTPYTRLLRIDARDGVTTTLARARGSGSIESVRLAPSGAGVCYDDGGTTCRDLQGRELPTPPGANTYGMVWSEDGASVLYPDGAGPTMKVADFLTRTARSLDLAALHSPELRYWHFFPGTKRFVTYQAGAWVCDVGDAQCFEVHPPSVEPGGFAPVPGSDRRFLIGVESGATRHFSIVELAR